MAIEPFKLSETNKKTLENLTPDIVTLEKEVKRAERAGIDVTELQSKLAKVKLLREGILREYGK